MDELLKKSLAMTLETSADLLEVLQTIIENAEYKEDCVELDLDIMNDARLFLADLVAPLMVDNTTLH
tara:strand:- start:499 stop:699 length:201 start_codon:yes stop_codon:yes gene_type:complete